jgi:Ser/Thr protein kinase RdoA (MazF antagonist)
MAPDRRPRREHALAAVRGLAARLGLDASGLRVLNESNNTVVLLPASELIAKVSTSILPGRGADALGRELAVGRRLALAGAPIAPPAAAGLEGPHDVAGVVVTCWRYVEPSRRPPEADLRLGEALGRLHAALAGLVHELPPLTDRIERAHGLLQDPGGTPALRAADRRLAARVHDRLVLVLDGIERVTGLHGEPHDRNVVWGPDGPVLVDLEAVCAGPREWDLAYLPPASLARFPDRDDMLIDELAVGVSLCVAAWCAADPDPTPQVAEAARYHLDVLRGTPVAG